MPRILIVEDEEVLEQMYEARFTKEGYDVSKAKTAEKALEIAKKDKPDFILLDIILLESTGITFLQERMKDPKLNKIPVLAFSAYNDEKTKKQALQLGVLDYFLKTDYTPNTLIKWINNFLSFSSK